MRVRHASSSTRDSGMNWSKRGVAAEATRERAARPDPRRVEREGAEREIDVVGGPGRRPAHERAVGRQQPIGAPGDDRVLVLGQEVQRHGPDPTTRAATPSGTPAPEFPAPYNRGHARLAERQGAPSGGRAGGGSPPTRDARPRRRRRGPPRGVACQLDPPAAGGGPEQRVPATASIEPRSGACSRSRRSSGSDTWSTSPTAWHGFVTTCDAPTHDVRP